MLNALWVEAKVKEHFNCIAEKKTSLNYVIGKSDWTLFCCARGIQICLLFISTDNIFFIFSILVQRKKTFLYETCFLVFFLFPEIEDPDRSSRDVHLWTFRKDFCYEHAIVIFCQVFWFIQTGMHNDFAIIALYRLHWRIMNTSWTCRLNFIHRQSGREEKCLVIINRKI